MLDPISNPYPVNVQAQYVALSSRPLAALGIVCFLKAVLLLPHLVVLYFLNLACFIVAWVGFWIVMITGTMPKSLFDFMTGCVRWQTRTTAWLYGLTDEYPPFSLE